MNKQNPDRGIETAPGAQRENARGISYVSIPRSGFCLFILETALSAALACSCFNPSVGILFVHTDAILSAVLSIVWFQSLGRDSVCSYLSGVIVVEGESAVSIPRSGFCLFIPGQNARGDEVGRGFNPSVGILFVHTRRSSM